MLLHLPAVLGPEDLARIRAVLDTAAWDDGRRTAGYRAQGVKNNLQLPPDLPGVPDLGALVGERLSQTPLFVAAALPLRMLPPRFNRYADSGHYGDHVDNAIFPVPGANLSVRTDLSVTVFLNEPEDYDGGDLIVRDRFGEHGVKFPAGDAILYTSGSFHRVTPVTRGARLAAILWVQSLVPQANRRQILYDLDVAIQALATDHPEHGSVDALTAVYHNLLRDWSRT